MSGRISTYIRNNLLGLIAIYLALGGISVAEPRRAELDRLRRHASTAR